MVLIGLDYFNCLLFALSFIGFFVVTMASSLLLVATSAPLGATPSAQLILHTIQLQPPPEYKEEIDYEDMKAWIYSITNYFALPVLTNPSQ